MSLKVVDLHCDLLHFLLTANSFDEVDIPCSLPNLKGNVALQIFAIYSATKYGSSQEGLKQAEIYSQLVNENRINPLKIGQFSKLNNRTIGSLYAIENASSFCEEDENLEKGFSRFETIVNRIGLPLYIGLTHHLENRFGGGNFAKIGLKNDGKMFLDFLSHKNIAIDLAHTSDELARDIISYIKKNNYPTKIIASHSNSRSVQNNPRNLPDDFIREIIDRQGLIGINFIKDYIDPQDPNRIFEHIEYILKLGGENCLAYGADFFNHKAHPDKSRFPFFFDEYNSAKSYNALNQKLIQFFGLETAEKISYQNAINFIENLLKS